MISFGEDVCRQLDAATRREWLETNGLGGYASSTITCLNSRRYHGLLVAAVVPPTKRVVLLSKVEEVLVVGDERFELATNLYEPDVVSPQGYNFMSGFRLDPFPVFTFRAGGFEIEKTIFMAHGQNSTVVRYGCRAPQGSRARLELRPLVAFRDYHSLTHGTPDNVIDTKLEHGLVRLGRREDELALYIAHDAASLSVEGLWYRNFSYAEERARGFDFNEGLFNPCLLTFDLEGGKTCNLVASTEPCDAASAQSLEESERERRQKLQTRDVGQLIIAPTQPPTDDNPIKLHLATDDERAGYVSSLIGAADQFIVRRGANLSTIIAGYHWFTDWGRDTMISLPGLALATGRFDVAREILLAFARSLNQGLIPNRFPDEGEQPEYNTADATLWFVNAIGEYLRRTDDEAFVRENLYQPLLEIIDWHQRGTYYDIRMTDDSLLRAGGEDVPVTWMDVKIAYWAVTPRAGKPVEIQALWYNALRTVERISARFNDEPTRNRCRTIADAARASFNGLFWNEERECLYDNINDGGEPDDCVRPNQIFAVSLPHAITTGARAKSIVACVERELLTPFGLRTLARDDANYRGRYEGDAYSRDTAYHQGTVWAWLMGPFITAYLKVHGRSPESVATAHEWLANFRAHLREAGVGQISEIFDGDPPHVPRGCIAQAWSIAEILRCELEELT
jgi:predicted glycogen debranching enzyme